MPSARSLAALNTPPGPRGLCGQRCGRWRAPRALTRVRRGFAPLTSMLGSDARHPTGPHHAAPTLSTVLASPPGPPLFSAAPPPAARLRRRRRRHPRGFTGPHPTGPHPTAGPPRTRRRDCSPTPLRCAEATTARPPPVGPACCDGWAGGGSLHAPTCLSGELAARWVRAARALEPPVARARRAATAAPRPPRLFRGSRACGSDLSHAGALRPLVVVAGDVGAGKRAILTPRVVPCLSSLSPCLRSLLIKRERVGERARTTTGPRNHELTRRTHLFNLPVLGRVGTMRDMRDYALLVGVAKRNLAVCRR